MKTIDNNVHPVFRDATKEIIKHFKKPSRFISFIATAVHQVYSIDKMLLTTYQDGENQHSIHSFLLYFMQDFSKHWINTDEEQMVRVMHDTWGFGHSEYITDAFVKASAALIWSTKENGNSYEELISHIGSLKLFLNICEQIRIAEPEILEGKMNRA